MDVALAKSYEDQKVETEIEGAIEGESEDKDECPLLTEREEKVESTLMCFHAMATLTTVITCKKDSSEAALQASFAEVQTTAKKMAKDLLSELDS